LDRETRARIGRVAAFGAHTFFIDVFEAREIGKHLPPLYRPSAPRKNTRHRGQTRIVSLRACAERAAAARHVSRPIGQRPP
jgi:hypothetical protein